MNRKFNYYTIIRKTILDEEGKQNDRGTFEHREVNAVLGCDKKNHAIEVIEEFLVNGETVHADIIATFKIGKCTCNKEKNFGFFGVELIEKFSA